MAGTTQKRKSAWRRKWHRLAGPLLSVACLQAGATHTICDFISDDAGQTYAFEFIGAGSSVTMIQVNAPRGARLGRYHVETLDPRARRLRMTHAGAQGDATLPSFALEGQGDDVRLRFAGRDVGGALYCQAQHDD